MRKLWSVIVSVLLLMPVGARAQATTLASTANVKVGDVGAILLHNILALRSDLSDPTVVTYEPEPNTIDVEIFGTTSSAERAKEMVTRYWEFIRVGHIPYMQRRFNVNLTAQNYRISYYDRTSAGPKLILQYVNGQYIMGP